MLIVSKFKDYYDSVAYSKGIDKTIVYKRETLYVKTHYSEINTPREVDISKNKKLRYFVVGFCGKLYGGGIYNEIKNGAINKIKIIYDVDNIKTFLKDNSKDIKDLKYYLSRVDNLIDEKYEKYFREYNTSSFVIFGGSDIWMLTKDKIKDPANEQHLSINHNLKEVEFYKVMDPYAAFQEIEMYISGVLGNSEKEIINISDKDKIMGHGFDYKHSFRKEKENK